MDADELKRINEQQAKEIRDLKEKLSKMEQLSSEVIWTLSGAIDAKDSYTSGHSRRVAEYTWKLSKKLGKSKEEQKKNYYVGLLHDIGKIGVPDGILNKTGRLTDEEFAVIKGHPDLGEEILVTITLIEDITVGAKWHHERYDGTGYPDRLKGEEIPELPDIPKSFYYLVVFTLSSRFRLFLTSNAGLLVMLTLSALRKNAGLRTRSLKSLECTVQRLILL